MDYNRVVADLWGHSDEELMQKIALKFDVEVYREGKPYKPDVKHTFGMYLNHQWYKLAAKPEIFDSQDVVARLDVSILQDNLLSPILGINDPRTDKRIEFIGGLSRCIQAAGEKDRQLGARGP